MTQSQRSNQHLFSTLYISLCLLVIISIASSISNHAFAQNSETNTPVSHSNASEILTFANERQQNIYQDLILELRCPKCQNQNIADSNADIAQDMRAKVYEMVIANKTKSEIKEFMQARFGEFVLYKPQFSGKNLLLWLGPIFALLAVILFVIRIIRKNAAHLDTVDDEIEQ